MATYTTNYNLEKPEASDPFGDFRESYNDNLDIIDANLGGGGGSSSLAGLSDVDLTTPTDGQVLTYDGINSKWVNANGGGGDVMDVEVNGVSVVDGNKVAKITSYKEVTQAQYDALPASKLTDGIAYFIKDGGGSGSGGSFLLVISAETGETVTATKDGTTLTATEVSTGVYEIEVTSAGTWTLSDGTNTETVDVGVYTATLSSIPEGSTVTPTDDVTIWLACAGISENYTTVGEVLADSTCLLALLSDNNANDYLVRSTTWASTITADSSAMTDIGLNNYCANTLLSDSTWCNAICNSAYFESVLNVKVPVMTSATTPSGQVYASPTYQTNYGYYAFDENTNTKWLGSTPPASYSGNYIAYRFPTVKTIYMARIRQYLGAAAPDAQATAEIQAGINNDNFETVKSNITWYQRSTAFNWYTFAFDTIKTNCDTFRILYISGTQANALCSGMSELQFYGREDV